MIHRVIIEWSICVLPPPMVVCREGHEAKTRGTNMTFSLHHRSECRSLSPVESLFTFDRYIGTLNMLSDLTCSPYSICYLNHFNTCSRSCISTCTRTQTPRWKTTRPHDDLCGLLRVTSTCSLNNEPNKTCITPAHSCLPPPSRTSACYPLKLCFVTVRLWNLSGTTRSDPLRPQLFRRRCRLPYLDRVWLSSPLYSSVRQRGARLRAQIGEGITVECFPKAAPDNRGSLQMGIAW